MTTSAALTHFDDQLHAASRHATTLLAAAGPHDRIPITAGSWLLDQATALIDRIQRRQVTRCRHITSVQVMHTALWAPGHIVCSRCIHALTPQPGQENVCDHCHQPQPALYPGATAIGPIVLAFGLCPTCATTTGLHPRKDTPR